MKIYHSDQHPVPEEIIEMLEAHALSFSIVSDSKINGTYLEEGQIKVNGVDAIKDHLNTLIQEVKQGWYCNC